MVDGREIVALYDIYKELNTKGKEQMMVIASRLLDAQKAIKDPVLISEILPNTGENFVNSD